MIYPFEDWPDKTVCDTCSKGLQLCPTFRRLTYHGNGCPDYSPSKYQLWREKWEPKIHSSARKVKE